ncbi:hypothetical protein [Peribacillus sp. Hz7]|uniref:hypothetical protein n=1 Tax=Peribacillus sp. Hz7 TaxID=3344873 RepID=UPI0035C97B16
MEEVQIRFSVYNGSEKVSFDSITDLGNHEISQQIKQKVNDCELKITETAILHLLGEKIGTYQSNNIQVTFTEKKGEPPING